MAFVLNNGRMTNPSSPEEIERIQKLNAFADAVVNHMKDHELTPDDWEELEQLIARKIHASTKNVWKGDSDGHL